MERALYTIADKLQAGSFMARFGSSRSKRLCLNQTRAGDKELNEKEIRIGESSEGLKTSDCENPSLYVQQAAYIEMQNKLYGNI